MQRGLKSGMEGLSGMSLDHVRVHYNSIKPHQLGAHAYAQGASIHTAMAQSHHVPHELGHVVQQSQGWHVLQNKPVRGVNINDDADLESEADIMGNRGANG